MCIRTYLFNMYKVHLHINVIYACIYLVTYEIQLIEKFVFKFLVQARTSHVMLFSVACLAASMMPQNYCRDGIILDS